MVSLPVIRFTFNRFASLKFCIAWRLIINIYNIYKILCLDSPTSRLITTVTSPTEESSLFVQALAKKLFHI